MNQLLVKNTVILAIFSVFLTITSASDEHCAALSRKTDKPTTFNDEKHSCPEIVSKKEDFSDMVLIKSGKYIIGTDDPVFVADGESPARAVQLEDYYIDIYEVSNEKFASFARATNYVTEAEKFGSSFVFSGIIGDKVRAGIDKVVAGAPWWMPVEASWKAPEGPGSSIDGELTRVVWYLFNP